MYLPYFAITSHTKLVWPLFVQAPSPKDDLFQVILRFAKYYLKKNHGVNIYKLFAIN